MTVAPSAPRRARGLDRPFEFVLSVLGLIAVVLALPVVLLLGGPVSGWLLGAVLWAANWGAQLTLARFAVNMPATHAVGLSGFSFIGRAWLVAAILFVVALKFSETAGLTAAGVFLVAFTFDLMGRTLLFATRERERGRRAGEGGAQ
jgi:hypothetical protein